MAFGGQQHILLVEDDEDTLDTTTAMLERLGYNVRSEVGSLKALRTFSEEPDRFDLALLNHGMADLTGLELAQRMRHIHPGFPVVLYTGYLDDPSTEQLEATGVGGRVIIKPASLKELSDVIQEALGGWAKSAVEP
jgi:two-component system cell cycle sensor histidine kinase/response regulator CckA